MLHSNTFFYRSLLCLVVTIFFLLHITEKIDIPLLDKVENSVYDLRLQHTMISTIDPRIVILDIDEKSLAQEGRWPWSRDKLSDLVDILFEYYEIKVLGFDITFPEPDTTSGLTILEDLSSSALSGNQQFTDVLQQIKPQLDFDSLFAKSLANRSVVLGYYFNNTGTMNPNSSLPSAINTQDIYSGLTLIEANGYGANLNILQASAIYGGYFNNDRVDTDGSYRRLPLITEFEGQLYETLALAIYRSVLGHPAVKFRTEGYGENSRLEAINIESLSIPVNEQGVALVPYRGKQGSFNYISATDVLNGEIEPDQLTNKIVIMGSTAAGILDLRTTPVQNVYPGVEVHANLISGMLDGSFKSRPSYMVAAEFLELLILAVLVIFLYPKLSSSLSAVIFSLLTIFIVASNLYLWTTLNIANFLATPMIFLFILFSIQIYFGYFLETKKKNQLGKMFGQYIPAELVFEMSQSEHEFSLKGKNKQMSVLFSDVRGFTTISESMKPEELCDLINEILTPITQVIHENSGTIDKYIGDAVMAFWGAPLDDSNHASHAINAALNFIPALEKINQLFAQKKWPIIDIGIGINTGEMIVGNMGSEFRMAYTVMGDSVNLGSRLEGLTKQYGVRILVSETTKNAASEFVYLEIDRVKVKGKDEPITIYEPLGLRSELSEEAKLLMPQFKVALELYHAQQWREASRLFNTLKEHYPERKLFDVYLNRINEYIIEPPAYDWDGVFIHTAK